MDQRIEHDSLGDVAVPADAYYGAQTARAVLTNPIVAGILSGSLFGITGLPIPALVDTPLMMLGHAAGVGAALAARRDGSPGAVAIDELQQRLRSTGQVLAL